MLQLEHMEHFVTVHVRVPKGIWMALRADAMGRGRSAQDHVVEMFRMAYGVEAEVRKYAEPKKVPTAVYEPKKGGMVVNPVRGAELKKAAGEVQAMPEVAEKSLGRTVGATPATGAKVKEESPYKCHQCGKATDGEFLCKECK